MTANASPASQLQAGSLYDDLRDWLIIAGRLDADALNAL